MSRQGRAQPLQPFATHGFLGNIPANGVLPGRVVVVENDDRRRKTPPLQPVVVFGGVPAQQVVVPPQAVVVDRPERRRHPALDPTVEHGFLGNTPANGTTPPPPVNVDRVDQRKRYLPLDPIVLDGVLAALTGAPTVLPPAGPFVVPLDERRRFLAALPPTVIRGFDDVDPPAPNVVEPERRRRLPVDPTVVSGVRGFTIPFVKPPAPLVAFVDDRGRRIVPQPIVLAGKPFPAQVVTVITQAYDPREPVGGADGHALGADRFDTREPGGGADSGLVGSGAFDTRGPGQG